MKAVFLTAGAAGMYCGSCMHDNALAKCLRSRGVDCLLQPVYTPIRTDAESVASEHVFFGGIHVYLLQQLPWLRHVPAPVRRLLDWPPLVRWATARAGSTDASKLGDMAVSMLRGTDGRQADEVRRLAHWLATDIRPGAIVFSNLLIAGSLSEIRRKLPDTRIVVLLQGDDIFLEHLPQAQRSEAIGLCRDLIRHVDHVVVNSRFYANKMGEVLSVPEEKIVISPLSIDTSPFDGIDAEGDLAVRRSSGFRLGYLVRIAPEKGLHHLVDAFITLAKRHGNEDLSLHVAGWLGAANRPYLDSLITQIGNAGLADRFSYHGSPNLNEKVQWLRTIDLCCVPTEYHDPKGLFVLESLAAGVPVVQPDHGAFGELIASTGGGRLVSSDHAPQLCEAIQTLKDDESLRLQLGITGQKNVREKHSIERAADHLKELMFGQQ